MICKTIGTERLPKGSVRVFEIDYTASAGRLGTTASASTWESVSDILTLASPALTTNTATVQVTAAKPGETKLINTLTFADGQVDKKAILVKVYNIKEAT